MWVFLFSAKLFIFSFYLPLKLKLLNFFLSDLLNLIDKWFH